ncbi:MAG: DUF3810 domain-containing protein [Ruminococcus sp.]|nr:DUF3810 domain-containing protein [Ruminococcus sp.]
MSLEKLKASIRRRRIQFKIICALLLLCVILNILAWQSTSFSDWYVQKVFPVISVPFAFLTEKLPFSLGEILILIALIGVPLSIIAFIVLMIVKRKSKDAKRTIRHAYGYTYAWIIVYIVLTETLNCFILYHTSYFAEMYDYPQEQYTASQLEQLAWFLIDETNAFSEQVERNDEGQFVLTADLDETAKAAMLNLANDYPQLSGYYTTPKSIINSFFMSQQYLMGIYFPFTMEANYNDQMYELNMPDTVCHELAHTKGFIREDEANFIGFLACYESDNIEYNYSGSLRALKYVLGKCEDYCSDETVSELYTALSDGVRTDWNSNVSYWQEVQESDEGLIDSQTVAKASDKAMETSLKLNGVEDGKNSYGRMVDLLLDWYYMNLEDSE